MKNKVTAIVPAAGLGNRFGDNKTLAVLGGRPLIIWALEALATVTDISEIIPVIKESDMEYVAEMFDQFDMPKVKRIVPGGRERQDSVFNGLSVIDDRNCIVLVHDGVRPLIEPDIITYAINQLKDCDGVVVGVLTKDTIKEVREGIVTQTLQRDLLRSVQTPQIFGFETIYNAYENAKKENFYATDDSALVERYGGKIKFVVGSYTNIKITTPEDLMIAEVLLKIKNSAVNLRKQ
jgi:2-C-methyl-D-erythritol 4-phosphate cytidylyltransferase